MSSHYIFSGYMLDLNPSTSKVLHTYKPDLQTKMMLCWWNTGNAVSGALCLGLFMNIFLDVLQLILNNQEYWESLYPVNMETSQPHLPLIPYWDDCSWGEIPSSLIRLV